ncbi:MAG: hypothetical protein ABFS14_12775 [Gemmatimonadota bacterium]
MNTVTRLGLGAVAVVSLTAPLEAQEDFRAADLDRPILVEDAFPAKLHEWEVELGARGGFAEGGDGIDAIAELKTGLFLNGQVGLEMHGSVRDDEAGFDRTISGIETVRGHALFNLNRETWSWPAVAIRADLGTPGTGGVGQEDWRLGIKGIASRSFGLVRLHANGGYVAGSAADGGDFWQLGLAFDYPIGLFSKALMGDVYAEIPVDAGRARVWAELGTRWQISNASVLDFGISTRLDEWEAGRANLEVTVGVSRVFGLSGLVSVPPYPDPRLD